VCPLANYKKVVDKFKKGVLMKFGLTKENISEVFDKIENQKDFLWGHYIEHNNEKIPLASFFKNTFINPDRYIAELQHRVWSLSEYASGRNLVNIFITLTLPSAYHPNKTLKNGKIIRNPRFANGDMQVFDIFTKKRPDILYMHNFKVHRSSRLNLWTGKVTKGSIVKRKYLSGLKDITCFDDLFIIFDNVADILRTDIEIYDIFTKKRTIFYQNYVFKQKSIASVPRFDGTFSTISLLRDDYAPVPASKALTNMWASIRKDRSWSQIDAADRLYFRATEPHGDGTPHVHISAWVPACSVQALVEAVHRLYPAPLADIATSYIPESYKLYEKVYKRDGSWHNAYKLHESSKSFIKLQIQDTTAYLMKYIYKTLDDLRTGKGITEITMWYIYHGICRFYTSRTLISLNVYRPLNGKFNLLELTQHYNNNTITVLLDPDSNIPRLIQYDDAIIWNKKDFELKQYDRDDTNKDGRIKLRKIEVEIDGEQFYMYKLGSGLFKESNNTDDNALLEEKFDGDYIPAPIPSSMKILQLWNYYNTLDPDDPFLNLHHYGHVKNTMIKRGLIDGEILPVGDFNTNFYDMEVAL
jgi:hypothetical protein